jgi:hypothetical protein
MCTHTHTHTHRLGVRIGQIGSGPSHRRAEDGGGRGEDMCVDSLEFRHYELLLAAGDGGCGGGGSPTGLPSDDGLNPKP